MGLSLLLLGGLSGTRCCVGFGGAVVDGHTSGLLHRALVDRFWRGFGGAAGLHGARRLATMHTRPLARDSAGLLQVHFVGVTLMVTEEHRGQN